MLEVKFFLLFVLFSEFLTTLFLEVSDFCRECCQNKSQNPTKYNILWLIIFFIEE